MKLSAVRVVRAVLFSFVIGGTCAFPAGLFAMPGHTLFLDFDGNPLFPEFGQGATSTTNPLLPFNATGLNSSFTAADTAAIRAGVTQLVAKAYGEFDVLVTDVQPTSGPYQTVGVDHRAATVVTSQGSGSLFGIADFIDPYCNDVDYGRTFGGSFSPFSEFQGANSTVARWTKAIGYTTAHEAGHNAGLYHGDATPTAAELALGDNTNNHIMATGSTGLTMTQRAVNDRHFSGREYSLLAACYGLNTNTLFNWDFRNPNNTTANDFHIVFLSKHPSLTKTWEYLSPLNQPYPFPFGGPGTVSLLGTATYQGQTYNKYEISWSGGPGAAPGTIFHTGVAFQQSPDFIVQEAYLTDNGTRLPLAPRIIWYNANAIDVDGNFTVELTNPTGETLRVRDLRFQLVSRMIDINSMTDDPPEGLRSPDGDPVAVESEIDFGEVLLAPGETANFVLANLRDWRAARLDRLGDDDGPGPAPDSSGPGEPEYGGVDWFLDMFPSTYVYATGKVVQENATFWDPAQQMFVTGDLESGLYMQFSGIPQAVPEPGAMVLLAIATAIAASMRASRAV
jgi:hypothetical protein